MSAKTKAMKEITIEDVLKKHSGYKESDGTYNLKHHTLFTYKQVKAAMTEYASLNRQGCRWTKASGQSKEDGWFYDADFLRTITEKVNEQEWGETLSMEEVESVLKVIESIEPCATSSENYWKQRCEAAEAVLNTFPRSVLEDQAGEDYLEYEKLLNEPE